MPTYEELQEHYWEDYDDQDNTNFRYITFVTKRGSQYVQEIQPNVLKQVFDMKKKHGPMQIRVYT